MKNIQVIDGAVNANYSIYGATDEEFRLIFPRKGQDIEFIEHFIKRRGRDAARLVMEKIWTRPIEKKSALGIHGTLFYGLTIKKKYYLNKREPAIDWRLVE